MIGPSNEEILRRAEFLSLQPENASKSPKELIRLAGQFLWELHQEAEDDAYRRHCEKSGYITEEEAASIVIGNDDHPERPPNRLSKLMGFLRARYDELTDTGREHRDQWTANPKLSQLPTLLRIHPPGQCTRAFCAYLKETIFPEWKQIEPHQDL